MRTIFATLLFFTFAFTANAQGEWEVPTAQKTESQTQKKQALINTKKAPIDKKYLEGAVPEVDGKICWEKKISLPGKSSAEVYDAVFNLMQEFVKTPEQTDKSFVAVVNKATGQIGVRLQEKLVFQNTFLSLDQTLMNYNLFFECKEGEVGVKFLNISYGYELERAGGSVFPAEEMISDREALNKKKTGFNKGGAKKFRTKTIDRKDNVFKYIEEGLAANK